MFSKVSNRIKATPLKTWAWFALALTIFLSVFFVIALRQLRFDYNFEKFFPNQDPQTQFYHSHRARFESDNDFLLLAIENKKGIYQFNFLKQIEQLTQDIEKNVPYIQRVLAITNAKEAKIYAFGGLVLDPYIHFKTHLLSADAARIYHTPELQNTLVATDGKSVCIFIRHKDFIKRKQSDRMLAQLAKQLAAYDFDGVHLTGRTHGQKVYVDRMMEEMVFFLFLSAFLIIAFLLLTFRSAWGVIVPMSVIGMATLWLLGGMSIANEPINILLITLPTILFVVAMADVIYIVSRFLQAIREGLSKEAAVRITYKEIAFSAFLTSFTTAIGFGSLYFVKVVPIQVFGVVAGIGTLLAYFFTMFLLPVLFLVFPIPKYIHQQKEAPFWDRLLRALFQWLIRHRGKVMIGSGLIAIWGAFWTLQIQTNNLVMDDLHPKEQLKKDFRFIDQHYGGIRPFDVSVYLQDPQLSFWDPQVLQELAKVEAYLENTYGAEVKNSLVQSLRIMNRAAHAGNPSAYELPSSKSKIKSYRRNLRLLDKGAFIRTILDSTERYSRLHGNLADLGSAPITQKNLAFKRFCKTLPLAGKVRYRITGAAHLLDRNIRFISSSLVEGLIFSVLLIALIMGWVYRSVRLMLISMIPNLIPLLVVGGFMGLLGIELKTSTAVIFTIAFGIAYDDTIHLLGKFRIEIAKGLTHRMALKNAYLARGKAMILSSLILCCGFSLLVFSTFMGSFYMGILISITLFVALISDLLLLPVLVLLFFKAQKPLLETNQAHQQHQ
jgi:predicted RND superfamily exporter protein